MEFLKSVFGENALTYAELEAALKDNKEIKLANLASGQYVDKEKFDREETRANELKTQLETANTTITSLKGLDAEGLKGKVKEWETKYQTDTATLTAKLAEQTKSSKIEVALLGAKAKNTKAVRALLDESKISLDGENVIGLNEQLEALKKDAAYLFGEDKPGNPPPPVGGEPPKGGANDDMASWLAEAGLPPQKTN